MTPGQSVTLEKLKAALADLKVGDALIYEDLPAAVYHAAPGLSNSVMKILDVSPLHCWYHTINPKRPERAETPSMRIGSALHAAVLEPDSFLDRYNCQVTKEDFEGCIDTVADIQKWLTDKGVTFKKSASKPELMKLATDTDPDVPILEERMRKHGQENVGRILLSKPEWAQVNGMAKSLLREPEMKVLLADGRKELSVFVRDPVTLIILRCRFDWVSAHNTTIVDVKSFASRGVAIDRTVANAIRFEDYHRQSWLYCYVAKLAGMEKPNWVFAFVESDQPHSVRLRALGENLTKRARYWSSAESECRALIDTYAAYQREFGEQPWVYAQDIVPLRDAEVPQIGWSSEDSE